jgi:hypothetical protein
MSLVPTRACTAFTPYKICGAEAHYNVSRLLWPDRIRTQALCRPCTLRALLCPGEGRAIVTEVNPRMPL